MPRVGGGFDIVEGKILKISNNELSKDLIKRDQQTGNLKNENLQ